MYSKTKRIACFLLCFLILFMGFAGVLTAPARAEPITIAAVSTLVWILGLMGITFASVEAARMASEHISNTEPDIMDWIDEMHAPGGGGGDPESNLILDAAATTVFTQLFMRLKEIFSGEGDGEITVTEPGYSVPEIPGLKLRMMPENFNYSTFSPSFSDCDYFYDMSKWAGTYWSNPFTFYSFVQGDGSLYNFIIGFGSSSGGRQNILYTENTAPGQAYYFFDMDDTRISIPTSELLSGTMGVGFLAYPYGVDYYLKPYFCLSYTDSSGALQYVPVRFQPNISYSYKLSGSPQAGVVQVPYKSDAEYSNDEIEQALTEKITRDGPLTVTIPQITEDTIKKTQEDIITDIEIRDILADIRDNTNPDPEDPDEEFDPDKNKMPQNLIYKFPFCVPFDLINLVGALAAEPVPPRWVFPISYPSFDFYYELEFDLTKFDMVAQVFRWATIIGFIYMLILQTRKLIKG